MRRPRRSLAVVALALAVVAFPLGALASHDFGDVPNSNIFHADISALADSGVTSGCGGGNYCPSANVTREQMAAFLNRLGALAPGKTPVVNADRLDGLDSSQLVRSDLERTGLFVCPAVTLLPTANIGYGTAASILRYPTADGVFACGVTLPDGATVTAARWLVYDASATGQIVACSLARNWRFVGGHFYDTMASVGGTGVSEALLNLDLEDATIDFAVVDNATYHYASACEVDGSSVTTSLFRFEVEYTVEGVPLP